MSAIDAAQTAGKDSPQSVQLFQRAHQKMVMLQRVEDQLQQLLNQRRSVQDELRGIQTGKPQDYVYGIGAGVLVLILLMRLVF